VNVNNLFVRSAHYGWVSLVGMTHVPRQSYPAVLTARMAPEKVALLEQMDLVAIERFEN